MLQFRRVLAVSGLLLAFMLPAGAQTPPALSVPPQSVPALPAQPAHGAPALPSGGARLSAPPRPVARRASPARAQAPLPAGARISAIKVVGNQRIERDTILSYMSIGPGDPFDADRIDRSVKTLYATGLFHDVSITRAGSDLVVKVAENPIVNQIAFEGNDQLSDEKLRGIIQLRPRAVFTPAAAEADRQRILDADAQSAHYAATVEPEIIRLSQNRVNVVFKINDGPSTYISRIAFVGNKAFSSSRLGEIISSREEAFWRVLGNSDSYDPARLAYDKELLRQFYLKEGYIDFKVLDATAELAPDRSGFLLTFAVHEGARYRVGKIDLTSKVDKLPAKELRGLVTLSPGDWYDGDAVQHSVDAISKYAQDRGFAFTQVTPRTVKEPHKHVVDLAFDVIEGPHVYVQQINITGNTRTEDKVIRRQFRLAEGDPFNAEALRRSRQALMDLGYFGKNIKITPEQGSAPDRVIINTAIQEKATGELTLGGGYSTDIGPLANVGLRERNLVGTGIDAGISGLIAQKQTQVDLSVTQPYFLDRNLTVGGDLFIIDNNNLSIAEYNERRTGMTLQAGYQITTHLGQSWAYSLVQRNVYGVLPTASIYVLDEAGTSMLSQIGTSFAMDYRDSKLLPHRGFVIRPDVEFAGLGGDVRYLRTRLDGSYFIPLDSLTGNSDWTIALKAGVGYLFNLGKPENIIDRFFLGGQNLRGFAPGGVGPHDITTGDSLGGRFLWTQTTELRFPLPVSPDLGLSGRLFVDVGALSQASAYLGHPIIDSAAPRMGVGIGFSWNTPFGLINIDLADAVLKQPHDQTQVFRFGFGSSF